MKVVFTISSSHIKFLLRKSKLSLAKKAYFVSILQIQPCLICATCSLCFFLPITSPLTFSNRKCRDALTCQQVGSALRSMWSSSIQQAQGSVGENLLSLLPCPVKTVYCCCPLGLPNNMVLHPGLSYYVLHHSKCLLPNIYCYRLTLGFLFTFLHKLTNINSN